MLRLRMSIVQLAAVGGILLTARSSPVAAKMPKPQRCAPGRFLVDPADEPLLPGETLLIDALGFDAQGGVSLDGCDAGAPASVRAKRRATTLLAKWQACGTFAKVSVSARIASPACDTLTGRIKAKKTKAKTFTAHLSMCGDHRVDTGGGEVCDGSAQSGDASCPGSCVACACAATTTTSTTLSVTSTTVSGGCPTPPGFPGGALQTVTSASATITDLSDAPLAGVLTFIVGLNLASNPATTASNGSVTVNAPGPQLRRPVFRFGDALTVARLEIPLTTPTTSLGNVVTAPLPPIGAPLQSGTSAVSGGVSIAIAGGAAVLIDELTYDTADKRQFRAVALPVAKEAAVVTPSGLGLELLFGVAPAGTIFCPSATVTIPNDAGWPANAAVEFYVLGGDVGQDWAPFGGWAKISNGQVSADATTVSTSPGEGFPLLDAIFGVRLAPTS